MLTCSARQCFQTSTHPCFTLLESSVVSFLVSNIQISHNRFTTLIYQFDQRDGTALLQRKAEKIKENLDCSVWRR